MSESILHLNAWIHAPIEEITETVREVNASIVCMQELTTNFPGQKYTDTVSYLVNKLDYDYMHVSSPMGRTGQNWQQYNLILSRYDLFNPREVWTNRSVSHKDFNSESRTYIEVTAKIGRKLLAIGTTHMSDQPNYRRTPESKARETDILVKQIAGQSAFILTGDLNAIPGSYTLNQIEKYLINASPDYNQKTWTTKPGIHNDETLPLQLRLDYIHASDDIKITATETIDSASDHLGLYTEFIA